MENEWKEISGKDVDEAVTEALAELGTTEDKLEYEVIEEAKSGFLGIGSRPAKIRARIKAGVPEPLHVEERATKATVSKVSDAETDTKAAILDDENPLTGAAVSFDSEDDIPEKTKPGRALSEEEIKDLAGNFLTDVLSTIGMNAEINATYDPEEAELSLEVSTDDKGILIGKRGQTLDSLQYLASLVVNKESDKYIKVKLDSEDYRARRKETLENLAKNIALKVKRTGRPVTLEPMNSFERRIIHSAIQQIPECETRSVGNEPFRKVVISLTKEAYQARRPYNKTNSYHKPYNRNGGSYDRNGSGRPYGGRKPYQSKGGYSRGGYSRTYNSNRGGYNSGRRYDHNSYRDNGPSNGETTASSADGE